ncbi:C5a anaphylatoxin chemotactic receptor 2 isoform X1 [Sturnira hondurensis]|uniref:C5a anaphylatoxin chemotactic receptor 2 isoform X1 n=2 Tax=Sturnira hondurensis TaxID=192404 RepID=UPI00187AC428|nr:C5a anaphylatoxin chemotactic receptor 2 isoform X1 [Sturnira hondurensis]
MPCRSPGRRDTLPGSHQAPDTPERPQDPSDTLATLEALLQETVSEARMENTSLIYEYEHYGDPLDFPVDCDDGACVSVEPLRVASLLLYAAVFLVGVPGNAMLAWVTWKEARQRVGATWFLHLAVADLLCCLSLLVLSVPLARGGQWPYGAVGCWTLPSLILLSMYTSVLLLAALSADLCLLALRPTSWAVAQRACQVQVACGAAWSLALLLTVPSAVHRRLHQESFPPRLECVVDYGGSAVAEITVTTARFIFGFLGPLVVVASCHSALLCRAVPRFWPLGTAVVVGFFVCWAPYHILRLVLTAAAPHSTLLARALRAEPLVVGLALAHSCLNPLLFLYFGRAQLCRSLPATCRWALKDSWSKDESMVSKKSTSHDLVSEMEV